MYKSIFFCAFGLASAACVATTTCEAVGKRVATTDPSEWRGGVPYESCKAMPDDPNKLIMIMDDKVYVVDAATAKIVSEGDMGTTPFQANSYAIDTARYRLAPKTRAFAIRFASTQPHYHGGGSSESLNLYVVDGERIRVVMESLLTDNWVGGMNCTDESNPSPSTCATHYEGTRADIAIAKTAHHGYADLIVTTYSGSCDDGDEKENCDTLDEKRLTVKDKVTTLRFDGKQYPVPTEMQGQ